jgi:hypothetical protein
MEKPYSKINKIQEAGILFSLFLLLTLISYSQIDKSFAFAKYHFSSKISDLLQSYHYYSSNLKEFISTTSALPPGSIVNGWKNVLFLWPLFVFSKWMGGLSLQAVYCFTVTTTLIFLVLFYSWLKMFWSKEAAFWATFFLGYSAIFQEIARSGSFAAYSLLLAMVWIIGLYWCAKVKTLWSYLWLGVFTGIIWYGYGILRCLLLAAGAVITRLQDNSRVQTAFWFLVGLFIVIVPGGILAVKGAPQHHYNYFHIFFDPENIRGFKDLGENLISFVQRILGWSQEIEPPLDKHRSHAHFLNSLLVLPLLMGLVHALKFRRNLSETLLLILSAAIYLTPLLLTSSSGYRYPRRSLMYIIPTYALIGLGMETIFNFLRSVSANTVKRGLQGLIFCSIIFILFSEFFYFRNNIIAGNRDLGILKFAKDINKAGIKGKLYYWELKILPNLRNRDRYPFTVYTWVSESTLLNLALLNKGQLPLLETVYSLEQVNPQHNFYLAKSPLISDQEFADSCQAKRWRCELLADSQVVNFDHPSSQPMFFKLYSVKAVINDYAKK